MNDYFVYSGISTQDSGVYVAPKDIDNAPQRDFDKVEVPGRNGSLIIDNNRYKDGSQGYTGIIYDDEKFDEYISMFRNVVLGDSGYRRLEDTFHPDEYRMAYFDGDFSPKTIRLWHKMGKFEIDFVCKPQRFLKLGEKTNQFTASGLLFNPSMQDALPMIRVYGHGQINIGDYSIYVAQNAYSYIDIDCERMDAYYGNHNCNNIISLESDFPVLKRDETEITFDSTITKVQIIPRWWTL